MDTMFPTKILIASDDSDTAALAARVAGEIAEKTGSELHVVFVEPVVAFAAGQRIYEELYDEVKKAAQEILDEEVKRIEETGATVAQAHLRLGNADEEIIALSDELDSHLIIMGVRGSGPLRRLLGSTSDSVLRHANCPVMVVRSPRESRGRHGSRQGGG
ncbi:MAG TPA: universal stress protein [Rubrobacteraceae bacterium]|nr:universal stress protein [Rubrobacteraceae bacterium]